ncbi:ubiquitin-conjugating enzyme E2 U [Biomphalaria pfeifferi]|uniref:Ubiquitin-conjugating enzyme E2 U n=1 Tax=Biomphalaria pfeifferi TaxID=112525 RepID=A0AAD8B341_BIOPF|nr:ubiquitin-conjugating enzyme E2 U [Biomphalaria pfeifferi]
MYSRAHLLIELEQQKLQKDSPWGIEASILDETSIFEWMVKIKGLKNTLWEGGIFKVYIKFDEHYNYRPPQVYFQTIPFHPNVDVRTGKPCVDFLDNNEQWKENYSLSMILISLQTLLSNPIVKNAVNVEAAHMLLTSPDSYAQMVKECVIASQKVEAGETIDITETKIKPVASKQQHSRAAKTTQSLRSVKLSFEDYHKTWCAIATSKTKLTQVNPIVESVKDQDKLQEIHFGISRQDVEQQFQKQVEDHNNLVYGVFKNKPSAGEIKAAKLAQLNKMKEMYRPPKQSPEPNDENREKLLNRPDIEDQDILDKEVEDLVNWTNNLNSNAIDAT